MTYEKLEQETAKGYEAFLSYLQMGRKRSLRKLAIELGHPQTYYRYLAEWSRHNDWVARSKKYDHEIAKAKLALIKERDLYND
jgi:hypothetical protein